MFDRPAVCLASLADFFLLVSVGVRAGQEAKAAAQAEKQRKAREEAAEASPHLVACRLILDTLSVCLSQKIRRERVEEASSSHLVDIVC